MVSSAGIVFRSTAAFRALEPYVRGSGQVSAICAAGVAIVHVVGSSPVAVPAGGLGIVVLFALFSLRTVRPEWLEPGAPWLARHLGAFFVPILASAALAWRLPLHALLVVLAVLALSASAGFLTTALCFQLGTRDTRE